MKRFLTLVLLATFVVLSPVSADADTGVMRSERKLWLDGVKGNAAAGLRTFTLRASGGNTTKVWDGGYNLAVVHVAMDYTDGTTEVSMVCSASDDDSTLFVMQDCAVASGVCTSSGASWEKAISAADANFVWRVDITGYRYVSCVVAMASGTANEDITVSGYLTTN